MSHSLFQTSTRQTTGPPSGQCSITRGITQFYQCGCRDWDFAVHSESLQRGAWCSWSRSCSAVNSPRCSTWLQEKFCKLVFFATSRSRLFWVFTGWLTSPNYSVPYFQSWSYQMEKPMASRLKQCRRYDQHIGLPASTNCAVLATVSAAVRVSHRSCS